MEHGDYNTECPLCGAPIELIGGRFSCSLVISPDGWDLSEARWSETLEETFVCSQLCTTTPYVAGVTKIPGEYVFREMTKERAIEIMIESGRVESIHGPGNQKPQGTARGVEERTVE